VSDRDLAQQWLAKRLHAEQCGCDQGVGKYALETAAAILDTPGVEVAFDSNGNLSVLFEPMPRNSRRLVIRLPVASKEERDVQR